MKKIKTFIMCLMVLSSLTITQAQNTNNNFYEYTENMDAYFLALKSNLPDTAKVPGLKMYSRFCYFWKNRVFSNDSLQGDFTKYIEKMQFYFLNSSLYPPPITSNTWEYVGPKNISTHNQGIIVSLHIDPNNINNILAGTNASGMFKTTNGGQNWINVTDNILMSGLGVMDIAVNPQNQNIVYIASGNDFNNYGTGIYKSIDGCQTWQHVLSFNSDERKLTRKLLINPNNPNVLYAAVNDMIYRTIDAGSTWEIIFSNKFSFDPNHWEQNKYITELKFKPNDYNTLYVSSVGIKSSPNPSSLMSAELWLTHNVQEPNPQNITWSRITNGLPDYVDRIGIATNPHNVNQLFIGYATPNPNNSSQKIFFLRSAIHPSYVTTLLYEQVFTAGGYSTFSGLGYYMFNMEVSPTNQNIIYVGGHNLCVLNLSTNTFNFVGVQNITPNISWHVDQRIFKTIVQNNVEYLFCGNDGGVSRYRHDIQERVSLNGTGLDNLQYFGIGNSELRPDFAIGGTQDNGVIGNGQVDWLCAVIGDAYECVIDPLEPNVVYSTVNGGNKTISRSVDFGVTFGGYTTPGIPGPITSGTNGFGHNDRPFLMKPNSRTLYVGYHEVYRRGHGETTWQQFTDFHTVFSNKPPSNKVSAIAFTPANENVIIVGYSGEMWGNTNQTRLFRTTDGGTNWTNLTDKPTIENKLQWSSITDIKISEIDANKVWISFGGFWEAQGQAINRVIFSNNMGTDWIDITGDLPNLPINCLAGVTINNEFYVIAANDIGVFIHDQNTSWINISNELPPAIITDIEVNYSTAELKIATFGRGIWKTKFPCGLFPGSVIIDDNQTWNSNRFIQGNILIPAGKTLTINSIVNFEPTSKLIVSQGGKLIVDGGKLTSACNGMWQGIEVWGDRNASQLTPGTQGIVELRNGAVIENSLQAIRTIATDGNNNPDWSKTGGIVKANNAVFRNNKNGVWIGGYENIHSSTGNPINNVSHITNCTFEINDNYVDDAHQPYEFIGLCDVSGIRILGNTFVNNHSSFSGQNAMRGIVSYDASYTVGPLCVAPTIIPCPQYQPNTFEGLYYGIHAQNTNPAKTVSIKNNVFNDTFRAVALKNINHAEVVLNEFLVGASLPFDMTKGGAGQTIPFFSYSYGLSLENCTGYRVEENDFGSNHSNAGFGVIVQNSGTAPNQIYNNSFEELKFAVRAQGLNGGSFASLKSGGTSMPVYLSSGLVIKCNDFSNINVADISVTSGSIAPNQNYCSNDTKTPANNLFTSTLPGVFPYNIWINPDAGNIKYSVNPDGTTSPVNYTTNKVDIGTPCSTAFAESSSCPSYLLPASPAVLKPQILSKSMYAQTLAAQFDGGNTQALLDNIYQNKPAGELKNTLIAASPYLSDTVLLATVKHKPSPLPPGILKEILVPNSPLSPNVMQAVVGRTPSLPGGIMNEINSVQHGVSERELLEKELAYIEGEIAMLEKMLIQTWLSDTTYNGRDSVIAWFENKPQTTENQQFLVEAYIANAQLTEAMQMLAQINQATASDSAFVAYYTILTDLYVAGENIFALSPTQEQAMRQIAESQTIVSGNAQTVLWLVYGDEYELIIEELLLPDSMSIYGYLSSGAFCDYMPVAGDTLFLVDENMEPVAGMPYAVTNDDGYFIFNTHHFIFADTTKLYGISTKNAYQIDDVVFAPLHQLISSSPLELTHGDVRLEWFDLYAGPDSIYAIGTKIDLNGNIYVGGRTWQLNPLGNNVFLVKYSPQGERLWETVYNAGVTHLHEYLFDLETDSNGNSYMLFYSATTNDILLKFDDKGQLIWTAAVENIPNKKFRGINIEFDIYGNIIVAGHMDDYSQQTAKTDFFAAKFNENGQKIWFQLFDMSQNNNLMSMTTDKDGNIILSGSYYANSIRNGIVICYDNNGTLLWSNTYITGGSDIASVVKTDLAGNVYVAGNTDYINGFLLKYSPNGNLLWTDNNFSDLIPRALIIDSENMLYVGMEKWELIYDVSHSILKYISYSARKYNENGNVLWQSTYENPDLYAARFNSVTIDNNNYLYASGYAMPDDSTENSVAVTVKMDFDGNFVRTDIFSVPNGIKHQGNNLVVSENNNIYVAGQCYDTESIKMFTVKYSQCHSQSGLRSDQWYPEEEDEYEADVLPVLSGNSILVYPNPYSEQTTIELSFEDASAVKAEVYTITGQRVCTLHEGNLQQGIHSFSFSAHSHGFSSGVYVLKVIINNESMHRMLIEME